MSQFVVYLAVLHYISGQRQNAVKYYCKKALTQPSSNHFVEGRWLLGIDNNIDNVLGIVNLYQFVQRSKIKNYHECNQLVSSFNVETFANYLLMKISYRRSLSRSRRRQPKLSRMPFLSITDVLLVKNAKIHEKRLQHKVNPTEPLSLQFTVSELRRLLLLHSVEQMTLFQETISRDYQSVCTIVTTDIQAMYAYQCCQYWQCLELSQQNVNRLLNEALFFPIALSGPLTQIMDDDLTSFSAICMLTLRRPIINQLTLSLHLTIKSKLKLRHSIKSLIDDLHLVRMVVNWFSEQFVTQPISVKILTKERLWLSFIYRRTIMNIKRRTRDHTRQLQK